MLINNMRDINQRNKKRKIIENNKNKISSRKTKLILNINKTFVIFFIFVNFFFVSVKCTFDIKIKIKSSINAKVMNINGRYPSKYCKGNDCSGNSYNFFHNNNDILYLKEPSSDSIFYIFKYDNQLSDLKGLFKNCTNISYIDFEGFDFTKVTDTSEMFQNCTSLTSISFGSSEANNVIKMSYMFANCSSLNSINLTIFETSKVEKMDGIFEFCSNLNSIIQNFDTSKVTTMEKMFSKCKNLNNLDISNFDVSSVTNMNSMFSGCIKLNSVNLFKTKTISLINMGSMFQSCSSLAEIDLSNFDTSSVQFMSNLFHDCTKLKSLKNFDFNTEKVIKMESMFENCGSLSNLDLSKFYTPSLRQFSSMFSGCASLTNIDLSKFDTFQVTNFANLFTNCKALKEINLAKFITKMVTNMTQMFCNCSSLTKIDISNFDTERLIEINSMFKGCSALEEINLNNLKNPIVVDMKYLFSGCKKLKTIKNENFGTSNVKYMNGMFSGCLGFNKLDLSFLDTKNVINMNSMFSGCINLESIDITKFNTSNVEDIGAMFADCVSLTSIDLSNFDTSKVTNMDSLFLNCKNIKILSLSSFHTSNVQTMKSLFQGCSSFEYLNLSNFNTENTLYMDSVFKDCNSLMKLDLSNFTLNKVKSMSLMFYSCKSLTSLILPDFRKLSVTNTSYMFAGCSSMAQIDLSNFDSSSIEYMDYMFADCAFLKEIKLYNWNTRNVKTMDYLFSGCSSLPYIDISSFNTPKLKTVRGMFYSCSSLTSLDLSNLNTTIVENMDYMFYKAYSLTSINFFKRLNQNGNSYFNASYVENMRYMFAYCSNLRNVDLAYLDTSNLRDMSFMFKNCSNITWINLSNFDTSKVTSMEKMFENCFKLIYINLINAEDSRVINSDKILEGTPLNKVICINKNKATKIFEAVELNDNNKKCYNISCYPNYEDYRKKIILENNNARCVDACRKENKYDYLYYCYNECPSNITFFDEEDNKKDNLCKSIALKPPDCSLQYIIMNLNNCTIYGYKNQYNNTDEDKEKFIDELKDEIKYFDIIIPLTLKKEIISYELYNESYHFLTFSNKERIYNGTFIDFQDCENSLKKSKGMDANKELILFKIEYIIPEFKIPIIEYKILSEDGREEFNISVCQYMNFIYSIPVDINASEEYKYNPESEYNNELCFQYTTEYLTDIVLYDRRKEFNDYNLSLCEANCKYLRYVDGRVECECPVKSDFNYFLGQSDEEKSNMIYRFKNNHFEPYNFGVLKCFQMILTKESFKSNYANILFIAMMLLNVVSALIFWVKEYKELYAQAILLSKTVTSKPINLMDKNVKIAKNSNLITTGNNPPPKIKNTDKTQKTNFSVKNIDNNIDNNADNNDKKPDDINLKVSAPSNLIDSKNNLKIDSDKKNSLFTNDNMDEELEQTLLKTDMEMNMLSYSEAVKHDNRNCFIIYFSFLRTRQILICIFSRDFNAVLFKVSFFFFVFGTCIGINTIFFNDEMIHRIFEEKGNYSYQMHVISQIVPIIISGVGASIVKSLVAYITFTDIEILSIKKKNNMQLEEKINKALMKVSSKSTTFFILNFILMAIFWAYSSSFCAVFKNTQLYLFISGGISLGIVMLLPFLYYAIPALCRITAIKGKNNSCLYKFSQFVELI